MNRTSADLNVTYRPVRGLTVTLSDRANVLGQDGQSIDSKQTLRNDLREAYVTWELAPRLYVEAGRINVRRGIALGANPTDFFRAGSFLTQASMDPSVIRQNRLGTLVIRMQSIWNGGSASVLYAPKVTAMPSLIDTGQSGLNPRFDATNSTHRVLCTQSFELFGLSPELAEYFEQHRSKVGLTLSKPIGNAMVAYAEYAVGREANLIKRGFDYGVASGDLPPAIASLWPTDSGMRTRHDLAVGASFAIQSTFTINAEYHLHQGGLSRGDFDEWFTVARGLTRDPTLTAALWYPRAYANYEQEPVAQNQLFLHLNWPRAISRDLELSAFAFVNLADGSLLASLTASWNVSRMFTLAGFVGANVGGAETERGSLPQAWIGTGILTVYL